jgi:hypothetical protein
MRNLDISKRVMDSIDRTSSKKGCWLWRGAIQGNGYGVIQLLAHRVVFEMLKGMIPEGLTLDHRCKKRNCVNPKHLRVMSLAENSLSGNSPAAKNARRVRCQRGHLNWGFHTKKDGRKRWRVRECLTCRRLRVNAYDREHRSEKRAYDEKYREAHR